MYCNKCGAVMGETAVQCPTCGNTVPLVAVQRKLERPRKGRKVGGVCQGLANYFEIDVMIIRLLWVVAVFFGGTGVLAYFIAWIVIPEEPEIVLLPSSRTNAV